MVTCSICAVRLPRLRPEVKIAGFISIALFYEGNGKENSLGGLSVGLLILQPGDSAEPVNYIGLERE